MSSTLRFTKGKIVSRLQFHVHAVQDSRR